MHIARNRTTDQDTGVIENRASRHASMIPSPIQKNEAEPRATIRGWLWFCGLIWILSLGATTAWAVPMTNDPDGFDGIPWGTAFDDSDRFKKMEDTGRLSTFELRSGDPMLGSVKVESIRFMAIEGQFARVTVRYRGKNVHEEILNYLQAQYGPIDRTPGQIASGVVKFLSWQGFNSEITLRYDARTDQGIIFFESQTLRSRILDGNSATVF
jgi:hypothetical protein